MNKRVLLTMILALILFCSVSAISASDVNVTDSYTASLVDDAQDVSVPMENAADSSEVSVNSDSNIDNDSSKVSLSSEEVLESEDSNTLSTNSDSNSDDKNIDETISVSDDDNGTDELTSTSGEVLGVSKSSKVSISKTIQSKKSVTKYYKGNTKYSAKFTDNYGKALANTKVNIAVHGVTYTKTTNSKGVATLAIKLKPGTYKVTAENPKTHYKLTTTFKVLSTIGTKDITKIYTDGRKFYAKFLKTNGDRLANANVKFKINGNTYSATTNRKGEASLSLVNLVKGTHKITTYHPDGLKKTNKIKVITYSKSKLKLGYYILLKGKKNTIKAKLDNGLGYAPGEGKTIVFTIKGKSYSRLTNSKGIASLRLPSLDSGVYMVTAKFAGNIYYKGSSATNKVVIVDSKTPDLTVKGPTTFGKGAGIHFKVAVTSKGIPLQKRTVIFKVAGKSYTTHTTSKGIATLQINLNVGNYLLKYSVKKDSKINGKSDSTKITVKNRDHTSISWKSGNTFVKGKNTFKVLLTSKGKALAGKPVKLTLNSKTYTVKTNSKGYAKFTLRVSTGTKKISMSFEGTNNFAPSSASKTISVKKTSKHAGYWAFGADMKKVGLKTLASKGVSDIFLNYYAFKVHGKSAVKSWISKANKLGIDVHIWVQAFYDSNGWVNPVKNGVKNSAYFNKKIKEIKSYASVKGVAGIHLDYLRYPGTAYKTHGGTAAINSFVKKTVSAVHKINSNLVVSAALMPETTSMIKYYGQDYSTLSKYLDVVIPMIYKGNYGASSAWIKKTTQWYVSKTKGAEVWSGLQSYKSDSNTQLLSASALKKDIKSAFNGGASGVVLFRYGLSKSVDFNKLSSAAASASGSTSTKVVSVKNVLAAAVKVKNYYENNEKFPKKVKVGKAKLTMPEFLYAMSATIYKIGNHHYKNFKVIKGVKSASSPSGDQINSKELFKSGYLAVAKNVASYIKKYKQAPNYASSSVGKIIYSELLDSSSRILAFFQENNKMLPNYVTIKYGSDSGTIESGSGLNERNTLKKVSIYLKSTNHCPVGNSKIKAKVKALTKGLTSAKAKAKAIYNYVRDYVSYSFYYDTHQGALGTFSTKTGNCVDQAHLVISMFRTAGLAARYVHGTCTFSSGSTYGHVWSQVLIGKTWTVADPTSSRNSLGYVVNWNTNSYSIHGKYASLSF